MSHPEEEPEPTFVDPVKKLPTLGKLDGAKYSFVARDYEKFEQELKLAPYQFFRAVYNVPEDFNGSASFIVTNFVTGLVKELQDAYCKYFFNVYRCIQPSSDSKVYKFESLWIVNTPSLRDVYGDRCDDFTFTPVDPTNDAEFTQFLLDFRHMPVPEVEETEPEPEIVYDEPFDPFSFGGYDDEDEEQVDSGTVEDVVVGLEQVTVDDPTTASEPVVEEVVPVPVVEVKLNVLISEQYLH